MENNEVKLLGTWLSPYNWRVIWALKLKGITFEYKEEDLSNKSAMLLQYNHVHKKIPVLVHGGKPICESTVILQYIDEVWPQNPLMPTDPYERAVARFWIRFADDKVPTIWRMALSSGEEREKESKESLEILETIEEHGLKGDKKFFGGDKIGMVDLAFGGIANWLEPIELKIGVKLLEPSKFPRLVAWIKDFTGAPTIKDNLPALVPTQPKS